MSTSLHVKRVADVIDDDLREFSAAWFKEAVTILKHFPAPPGPTTPFPEVVVPTWKCVRAFVDGGGFYNMQQARPDAFASPGPKRQRHTGPTRQASPLRLPCWDFLSPKGCKREVCKYSHEIADSTGPSSAEPARRAPPTNRNRSSSLWPSEGSGYHDSSPRPRLQTSASGAGSLGEEN